MPLVKKCAVTAMSKNIAKEMKRCPARGKRRSKCQKRAVAIGYSVLRKACGVTSKRRMTPKQIVAIGKRRRKKR
jgi:hypothetical protein